MKPNGEKAKMAKVPYASTMGNFMYARIATRLNIAFGVEVISMYMANPRYMHWDAMKGMMCYWKGLQEVHMF